MLTLFYLAHMLDAKTRMYFKPLVVEGMKTCQTQVVWDLVETPKLVVSSRRNVCFSTAAPKSGVKD